jgi:alpha-L-fucosidase
MVWDIERGHANEIEPQPWQSDTCIGNWHYDRAIYNRNGYKTTATVIQMMTDVVSKNGCFLLSIPVRGDGTIDDKEVKIVQGIADWMHVNKQCIFGTHPWKVFGEGPATAGAAPRAQGFNESKGRPFTAADVRFTQNGNVVYAIVMGAPTNGVSIKSLGQSSIPGEKIKSVKMLGTWRGVRWHETDGVLEIAQPKKWPNDFANVFKVTLQK